MLPRLLTPDEVCEHLGCSRETLRKLHRSGSAPPYITVGSAARRYPEDQLAAWIAARTDSPPPAPANDTKDTIEAKTDTAS